MGSGAIKHVVWGGVALVMFFGGDWVAGLVERTATIPAGDSSVAGRMIEVEGAAAGAAGEGGGAAEATSEGGQVGGVDDAVVGDVGATVSELVAQRRAEKSSERAPLTKEEIEALALQATRSADPVIRRLAFDRLLEEMESDTFSMDQALTMRSVLHHNGADGEQWRLFDYAWGKNHPAAALAHLKDISERHQAGYLYNMIPGLAAGNPDAAIELYATLDEGVQGRVRKRMLEGMVDYDVDVATEYLYSDANTEKQSWRPMDELARELVKDQGIEQGLAWAGGLPEGSLRGNAWSAVYANWASRDPAAAAASIEAMPPSGDRDQAINGLVSAMAGRDGEAAAILAGEIDNPGMRMAAQVRIGQQFFKQDPAGAAGWFIDSGLPAEAWARIAN